MSFRFSLRDLLVLIAVICIACAALANTGIWWHSLVVSATLLGMTCVLIRSLLYSGESRAWTCGWLLFAAGYLALVFGPWTNTSLGQSLITSKGLGRLEFAWRGENFSPQVLEQTQSADYDRDGYLDLVYTGRININNIAWNYPVWTDYSGLGGRGIQNITTFQSTGHWLLASVFGYLGALLAAFLWRLRKSRAPLPG